MEMVVLMVVVVVAVVVAMCARMSVRHGKGWWLGRLPEISPTDNAAVAASNAGTIFPFSNLPRSPPLVAEEQSERLLATSLNVSGVTLA